MKFELLYGALLACIGIDVNLLIIPCGILLTNGNQKYLGKQSHIAIAPSTTPGLLFYISFKTCFILENYVYLIMTK